MWATLGPNSPAVSVQMLSSYAPKLTVQVRLLHLDSEHTRLVSILCDKLGSMHNDILSIWGPTLLRDSVCCFQYQVIAEGHAHS